MKSLIKTVVVMLVLGSTSVFAQDLEPRVELLKALNTYSYEQLMEIPGVTPRRAKSILTYRRFHLSIDDVSDLDGMPGFQHISLMRLQARYTRLHQDNLYAGTGVRR